MTIKLEKKKSSNDEDISWICTLLTDFLKILKRTSNSKALDKRKTNLKAKMCKNAFLVQSLIIEENKEVYGWNN